MSRLVSFCCALALLGLASTGCVTIFGDFTVGTESDGGAEDATVPPEAGSSRDGSSPDATDAAPPGISRDAGAPGDARPLADANADGSLDAGTEGGALDDARSSADASADGSLDGGAACPGTMPDSCAGACVNFTSDDHNCGGCGRACGPGSHCNGAGTCACVATATCKSLGDNCGSFVDDCKVTQTCGTCAAPDTCTPGANGAGACGCKATDSCESHGFTCGSFTDSCGNTPNCGSCAAPKTCTGANGAAGTCSCTPKMTCASLHATCGSFVDDCGNPQSCGTCASGSGTCSGSPGTCGGCNAAACGTNTCGSASEGANCPAANCGSCSGGQICTGASGPGTCECPSGTTSCSGTCVTTASDPNNCGFCGNRCGSGLRCLNGSCTCDVTSCSNGCCSGNICGTKPLWYPDNDGDSYGDENATGLAACAQPSPTPLAKAWVTNNLDCCDLDAVTNPAYLAANMANPWQIYANGCGNYLYNCEANHIPVMQFAGPPCSAAWHECGNAGNASTTGTVDCTASGCSAVCSPTTAQCSEYAASIPCGTSGLQSFYNCTTLAGNLCMAGVGSTQTGPQGCY